MTMNWPGFPGPPWGWGHPGQHNCQCHQSPCICCGPPQECWPPSCPPPPIWCPPNALRGPIIGVTDGSLAKPGEVGEYLYGTATITITIAQNGVSMFVAPLVVPPGDWTCTLTAGANFVMEGFNCSLDPIPPGVRNSSFVELDMAPGILNAYTGQRTFAMSNATPQLISLNVHAQGIQAASFDANNVPGQITVVMIVDARRMR